MRISTYARYVHKKLKYHERIVRITRFHTYIINVHASLTGIIRLLYKTCGKGVEIGEA